ncbi:MAG: AAA family ATPase [Solirubrobacterales bacterium]|nr:AAA family ATPase [Solirubrobacterales bacterium]
MVGRAEELGAVRRFLEGTREPAALVIEGEAGLGKSTLLRAGIDLAVGLGRRVLVVGPVEAEAEMAFAGLEGLLDRVLDEVLDELPTPQRVSLEVALLRREPGELGIEARTVASATTSVLRALASRQPLVLALDDLQWLDDASLRVLRVAFARLRDEPLLVLAAGRQSDRDLDLGFDRARLTRVALGGLSVESLRSLMRERLGLALSLPGGRRLAELTAGNPYYALELASTVADDSGGPFASGDLLGLVARRLTELPESTRIALGTLAAAVHPTVDQLSDLVGDERVLDPAFTSGVLEEHERVLRFAHPLLAAAAYQALPPGHRRAVHRDLAAASADPVERARHIASAAPKPEADLADTVELGARAAAARGAPTVAADLFEQAARLTPASAAAAAAARRVAAVREMFAAADGARAMERARTLVDELSPGDLRAEVMTTIAYYAARGEQAVAMCEQAVAESETLDGRARSLLTLSNVLMTLDVKRSLDPARHALALLEAGGDPRLRAVVLGVVGFYEQETDPGGRGIELLRQAVALQREHGSVGLDAYLEPITQLGHALTWLDQLDEARDLLVAQHAWVSRAGQEAAVAAIASHLAELEIRAGNLDRARAHADEAVAIMDEGPDLGDLSFALYARAHVAALQGEVELATSLATRGLAAGRAVDNHIWPVKNLWVLGQLALAQGDAARAAEYLAPLRDARHSAGFLEPGSPPFPSDAVEALVAAGRIDEARAMNDAWERLGRELDRPRLLATGARGRGLITAAEGDPTAAVAILHEALDHHARFPVPEERARTHLALGATLRRAGHRRDARNTLEEALATFEQLGYPLWAERARAELARLAGRKPADTELTATERQVAELVAQGRSNRDVADALFITVRTVEANLTRIYRKLEIRNRAELAAGWKHLGSNAD